MLLSNSTIMIFNIANKIRMVQSLRPSDTVRKSICNGGKYIAAISNNQPINTAIFRKGLLNTGLFHNGLSVKRTE